MKGERHVTTAYKIKEIRESKNMTQEELAQKSGISRSIISELETGKRTITTTNTLIKIAEVLGYSIKDIFL